MTLHSVAFGTYKVISSRNMRLDDDSVVETIRMWFIVIGVETRGMRNRVPITYVLHMKSQANLLLVSKLLLNGS
jgi:hypothetical protein